MANVHIKTDAQRQREQEVLQGFGKRGPVSAADRERAEYIARKTAENDAVQQKKWEGKR